MRWVGPGGMFRWRGGCVLYWWVLFEFCWGLIDCVFSFLFALFGR